MLEVYIVIADSEAFKIWLAGWWNYNIRNLSVIFYTISKSLSYINKWNVLRLKTSRKLNHPNLLILFNVL